MVNNGKCVCGVFLSGHWKFCPICGTPATEDCSIQTNDRLVLESDRNYMTALKVYKSYYLSTPMSEQSLQGFETWLKDVCLNLVKPSIVL